MLILSVDSARAHTIRLMLVLSVRIRCKPYLVGHGGYNYKPFRITSLLELGAPCLNYYLKLARRARSHLEAVGHITVSIGQLL